MLGLMLSGVAPVAAGGAAADVLAGSTWPRPKSPRPGGARAGLRAVDEACRGQAARPQLPAPPRPPATPGRRDPQVQALSLTQSVYGGETPPRSPRPRARSAPSGHALAALEQDVLLEAIAAYTAVARDRRAPRLARGNEERLRLQLRRHARPRAVRRPHQDRHRPGRDRATRAASRNGSRPRARSAVPRPRTAGGRQLAGDRWSPPPPPDTPRRRSTRRLAEAEGSWAGRPPPVDLAAAREAVAVSLAAMKPRLSLGGELSYAGRRPAVRARAVAPDRRHPRHAALPGRRRACPRASEQGAPGASAATAATMRCARPRPRSSTPGRRCAPPRPRSARSAAR